MESSRVITKVEATNLPIGSVIRPYHWMCGYLKKHDGSRSNTVRISWWLILFVALAVWLLFGCTPTVKQPLQVQRTDDLQHPCDRCGAPATENVSEVADEEWWRCPKCVPRDVRPRQRLQKPKLERNMV